MSLLNHLPHRGKYVHMFLMYVQTMHVTRLLYLPPLDSIGHETGTRQDQVKNTRLPPQNSSGALAP